MVDYRRDPAHYIAAADVTQVDTTTRLVDVFEVLAKRPNSTIIVHRGEKPAYYVDGRALARDVVEAAKEHKDLYGARIAEVLPGGTRSKALKQVIPVSSVVADVRDTRMGAIVLGSASADRGIYRVTMGEVTEGFLFSHESFKSDAMTPPAKFICTRGHENPDPDHGRCRHCPGKIVGIQ